MPENTSATIIDYYTDILCVWAWIAQPRLEELQKQWGEQIKVRHRYVDVFGDAHTKIEQRWGKDDGFSKFNAHVAHSAAPFPDTPINPAIWTEARPRSSMPAHLLLQAVGIVGGDDAVKMMALQIRHAFFAQALDVGNLNFLLELANKHKLNCELLEAAIMDGSAMAKLSADLQSARDLGIKGSPTWVLNEGRQTLYGNVGYRILNANIEELLKRPQSEASWC
jgi:predicted DsbA family dithiol-disulfide isomerase